MPVGLPVGAPAVVSVVRRSVRGMIIDCGTCTVRGDACADCVVTFLTIPVRAEAGPPGRGPAPAVASGGPPQARDRTATAVDLDEAERAAIAVLAGSGLVPPLRLRAV